MELQRIDDKMNRVGNFIKKNPIIVIIGIVVIVVLVFLFFRRDERKAVMVEGYPAAPEPPIGGGVAVPDYAHLFGEVIAHQQAMGEAQLAMMEKLKQEMRHDEQYDILYGIMDELQAQRELQEQHQEQLRQQEQEQWQQMINELRRQQDLVDDRNRRDWDEDKPWRPGPPDRPDRPDRPRVLRFDPADPERYKREILRAPIPDHPTREVRNGKIRVAAGHFEPIEDVIARQKERYERARARGDHKWAEVVRRETEIAIGRQLDW